MTKRQSRGTRALLEEIGDLGPFAQDVDEIVGHGIKVVSLVLDRVRPDPAQPRRVLPEPIRSEFLAGHINPRQALERWEALVAQEAAARGRPRPEWQALLLRDPEDRADDLLEVDPPGKAGPEEELLRSIVATAATIRHGGQVSPITVAEVRGAGFYRIETGERRYWAHQWLNMWDPNGYEQIQCIIVPGASPWRQAAENTSRENLSAMALARQLATLILDLHGCVPDYAGPIPNSWYRQALELRVPRGEGASLRAALGGVERSQISRILALLRLPDSVWELADRYRLEEKRLRYVLKVADEGQQLKLVRRIVAEDLSSDRVRRLVESGRLEEDLDDRSLRASVSSERASERIVSRWSRLASEVARADVVSLADEWVRRERPEDLRQQIDVLRRFLTLVEERVPD